MRPCLDSRRLYPLVATLCLLSSWISWSGPSVFLSPDRTHAAYAVTEATDNEHVRSRLFVCDAVAPAREVFRADERMDGRVYWLDDRRLACFCFTSKQFAVLSTTGETLSPIPLPEECGRVNTVAFSPDGGTLAFTGTVAFALDDVQQGLFLYDLARGDVAPLLEGEIWTRPAWSADGRRLAVAVPKGHPQGRVQYALGLVDLVERTVVEANLEGKGLAWSPDGSRLALAKDRPIWDGFDEGAHRVAVLDPMEKTCLRVSPPFVRTREHPGVPWAVGLSPTWSPDGKWIAYRRLFFPKKGASAWQPTSQLYVVAADGSKYGRIDEATGLAWSADSAALTYTRGGRITTKALADVALVAATVEAAATVEFSQSRPLDAKIKPAVAYDASPILARNRAWLVLNASTPASVSYILHTSGSHDRARKERFAWAAGVGAYYERDLYGTTAPTWYEPDGGAAYHRTGDGMAAYPSDETPEQIRRQLERRRGVPFHCAAMDWAAATGEFVIRRAEGRPLENQVLLEVAARRTPARLETPSGKYRISHFELFVDTSDYRIAREIDRHEGGGATIVEYSDFARSDDGGQVPQRLVVHGIADMLWEYDQRWFGGKGVLATACRYSHPGGGRAEWTLSDIALPMSERDLAGLKATGRETKALLSGPPPDRRIEMPVLPFVFGKYLTFETDASRPDANRLLFTLSGKRELMAELEIVRPDDGAEERVPVVGVLFDANASLLAAAQAECVFAVGQRTAICEIDFAMRWDLQRIRHFQLTVDGRPVNAGRSSRLVVAGYGYASGEHDIDVALDSSHRVRARRMFLEEKPDGLSVRIHELDTVRKSRMANLLAVVLVDREGCALAAGQAQPERKFFDAACTEFNLRPPSFSLSSTICLVGGVPGGTLEQWSGYVARSDLDAGLSGGLSIQTLLAADDPAVNALALRELERLIAAAELCKQPWEHTPAEVGKPVAPYRAAIARLIAESTAPEVLALAAPLLALIADGSDAASLRPLLHYEDADVRDSAVAAGSLVGFAEARSGIEELLGRAKPEKLAEEEVAHRRLLNYEMIRALYQSRTAADLDVLGRYVCAAPAEIVCDPNLFPEKDGLARTLVECGQPAAPWILKLLDLPECPEMGIAAGLADCSREAWVLPIYIEAIKRGRFWVFASAPDDPRLIPVAADYLLGDGTEEYSRADVVEWLSCMQGDAGVPTLRKAWEEVRGGSSYQLRVRLCRALMQHGDENAIEDALDALVEDRRQPHQGSYEPSHLDSWLASVLSEGWEEESTKPRRMEALRAVERRLDSSDVRTLQIMLGMIAQMHPIPAPLREAAGRLAKHPDKSIAQLAGRIARDENLLGFPFGM